VQHLEEGMLGVVARFAPDHGRGRVRHGLARHGHRLAVALHVELLQVCGEASQATVVRQHGERRQVEAVDVPDAQQPHQHRQVGVPGGAAEMLVHLVAAGQELEERVAADGDGSDTPIDDHIE
jgi:hypothetical protein